MSPVHPLKRKSVKPSSSTVRGMLPATQHKALEAALQSLRATGLRFEWKWKNRDVGWICAGFYEENVICELLPTVEPFIGHVVLSPEQMKLAKGHDAIPSKMKPILDFPIKELKSRVIYEFPLTQTNERNLFSDFVETLQKVVDEDREKLL